MEKIKILDHNLTEIKKAKFVSARVAQKIIDDHRLLYSAGTFYEYIGGCYRHMEDKQVKVWILEILKDDFSTVKTNEILDYMKTVVFKKPEELNMTNMLNLKNGLFCTDEYKLYNHDPNDYTTIQLDIKYDPEAKAAMWVKTVDEIFEGDSYKIESLQEFFGLCLTKETKYEKALFCIGEGANGKSVILNTLEKLLGRENCSAVPLEKFNNSHYRANLFGKIANITIEAPAKADIYDGMFKAIVSGDVMEADPKFKDPFTFNPFCKLVFALNNMPRVSDKTDAFFRRLLIIRFEKQFIGKAQNKKLKYELLEELNGIFNWSIDGLKRLRLRGDFQENEILAKEIADYRRENNNIIVFVDEDCLLATDRMVSKGDLYLRYKSWCIDNGTSPLKKISFGKELQKHYHAITETVVNNDRMWVGISNKSIF